MGPVLIDRDRGDRV